MSTLAVVEEILRETGVPMSVREIVERAGVRLPSKSKTPDTVVARDLAMDLKKRGEASLFARTSPGRYTLRALAPSAATATTTAPPVAAIGGPSADGGTPMSATGAAMGTLPARKPAAAAPSAGASSATGTGTRANAPS